MMGTVVIRAADLSPQPTSRDSSTQQFTEIISVSFYDHSPTPLSLSNNAHMRLLPLLVADVLASTTRFLPSEVYYEPLANAALLGGATATPQSPMLA